MQFRALRKKMRPVVNLFMSNWNAKTKIQKSVLIGVLVTLTVYQFYLTVLSHSSSDVVLLIFLVTLLGLSDINSKYVKYGGQYKEDPFLAMSTEKDYLILNKQKISLDKIKTVALSEVEDVGYVSFPFNHINGQPPTLYFDKGHLFYVRKFLDREIPNVKYIE